MGRGGYMKLKKKTRAKERKSHPCDMGHVLVVGSVLPTKREDQQSQPHQQQPHHTGQQTNAAAAESLARLYTALRHEELRPVCRYCGRSYSSPSNLRQHVKNVHSNWPPPDTWPQCNVCGKRCKTKHYLINHQLQAHGIHQRPTLASAAATGATHQQQQQQQQQQQPH